MPITGTASISSAVFITNPALRFTVITTCLITIPIVTSCRKATAQRNRRIHHLTLPRVDCAKTRGFSYPPNKSFIRLPRGIIPLKVGEGKKKARPGRAARSVRPHLTYSRGHYGSVPAVDFGNVSRLVYGPDTPLKGGIT